MAKKPNKTAPLADIEVIEPAALTEEQSLVKQDGDIIRAFIGSTVQFFTAATALEQRAKSALDMAQQWKKKVDAGTPVTREFDEQLQIDLRASKLVRAEVDKHWSIAQAVSRFHKRLTGARERAGAMADEAAEINQALHNAYVREQQRIAREQEDAARRVEEARLRAEQEADAKRLDEEAAKREAAMPDLSVREEAFVVGILRDGRSPFESAKFTGFASPAAAADRLMNSAKIRKALDERKAAMAAREQAAAVREQPVNAVVERVRPNIAKAVPGFDRTTWSGEVFDEARFISAALDPVLRVQYGIPADVLMVNQTKLNEYARSLKSKLNWPGVRAKDTTGTVTR